MLRLKRALRPSSNADPEDTLATKLHLADLGFYEPPTGEFHGWPDAEMFAGITHFQDAAGERPDGEMLPGGPTEAALNRLATRRPPIPKEEPNNYQRALAKGLLRSEDAISDTETWAESLERRTGQKPTPAAVPALLAFPPAAAAAAEAGSIILPGLLGGLGFYAAQDALRKADRVPNDASLLEAEGWNREALPPEKAAPPRDFDPQAVRNFQEEQSRPSEGPPAIDTKPGTFPIPDPAEPQIFIFPDMSGELPDTTILESRWGNDKTKAELHALNDAILGQHEDWQLRGGVPFGKEYWFPGPGNAFLDERGKRGDGRPGGRWADLTYELPDGSLVVVQHADVDANGEIAQHELDAARSISRPGVTVYMVPKQWQLDRVHKKFEKKRVKR